MSRYQPSDVTKALGLQAYNFRHGDSDDNDGSHEIRSTGDGSSSDSDDSTKFDEGSQEGSQGDSSPYDTRNFHGSSLRMFAKTTKFDEGSQDNSSPYNITGNYRGSSLCMSIETSGMDTVMTGDHVNAFLKVYNEEDLPWRASMDTVMMGDHINALLHVSKEDNNVHAIAPATLEAGYTSTNNHSLIQLHRFITMAVKDSNYGAITASPAPTNVQVIAPATLEAGYTFDIMYEGVTFIAVVPDGGD
eukprot:CAMPEP_0202032926 /NCGR_PEP_ID=MMETSP0905-20130828/65781_1 /ASSEMBLY_ACC=CAM_ASM_000554 /TAXON_ID=420261 /ORGANISM="Thalassiosira antarctica, Strain CCMP982" /LENGTH=245 /DNA_ID=CAMNT_0048596801 /DNA_START=17 /DNA_END=755 /DNA_ORIENTATION=-